MTHPLTPFAYGRRPAPYLATAPECDFTALVTPVISKSGFGSTKRGGVLHRVRDAASLCWYGHVHYAARWLCGSCTNDAVLINDPEPFGGMCVRCESAASPAVYRCYDADGRLLYIGSSVNYLGRMAHHKAGAPWWDQVARVTPEHHPTIVGARVAERHAIRAEAPLFNKDGRSPHN